MIVYQCAKCHAYTVADSTSKNNTICHYCGNESELPKKSLSKEAKYDSGKLRLDLVPPSAKRALAEVLTHGAVKYGENKWQSIPNGVTRYHAALERHLLAWQEGEEVDKESGLHHLKHVLCNAAFLVDLTQIDNSEK